MDDAKRRDLIKVLGDSKNFDSSYSEANRFWFAEKVIRGLEAGGLADSVVEQTASDVVQKAKTLVNANRDFSLRLAAAGNTRFTDRALRDMRPHRVQILYGAIAFHRQFVEPPHLQYLLFIAKRRFRGICRMFFWVNPNTQGYFRYPHRCPSNQHWRVNEDANSFWGELTPPWFSNYSPWKLKPSGAADPVKAIEKLFTRKPACKGNLFDCETTTSMVFMDLLREAKNEDQFIRKLASTGSEYLLIHGFEIDRHAANFAADTTVNGVMRTVPLPARDLQIGDQCYIINHPLYKTFRPTGSWTGEYSLVYATGDRDYGSRGGFVFGGHGKEGTLFQFYDAFLAELKSYLAIARQLMVAHLAFMRGGAAAIAPGTVVEAEHDIVLGADPPARFRLLEYDKNVVAKDYTKPPTAGAPRPRRGTPAFVIAQSKTEHVFFLEQVDNPDAEKPLGDNLKKKITDIVPPGRLNRPIKFKRLTLPPGGATPDVIFGLVHWGVAYLESTTGTEKLWPFFVEAGGKVQRKELAHADLFAAPFQLFTLASTDLKVRQPKVDFGAGHQGFLTANGAF